MKALVMGFVLAGFALAQGPKPAPAKTPVKTPVKAVAKSAAQGVTLPADAKKVGEGTWEHTDAAGKQWVYKQMPFGLTRMTKSELDARSGISLPEGMTVTEENGAYKFTRATPFGGVTYTKKADELSETERAIVGAKNRKAAVTAQK
jgi:hypothetical protein